MKKLLFLIFIILLLSCKVKYDESTMVKITVKENVFKEERTIFITKYADLSNWSDGYVSFYYENKKLIVPMMNIISIEIWDEVKK